MWDHGLLGELAYYKHPLGKGMVLRRKQLLVDKAWVRIRSCTEEVGTPVICIMPWYHQRGQGQLMALTGSGSNWV